ncbi:MAG: DNA repair protein RecN [Flavobacteriales bacterium]|nr:DNA repair protein RecN [Flavobacteriales bacterium]
MLHRLRITNYLLIDRLELELSPGLTIITGETGSGKSILIGALGLAMGERADAGLARDPRQRCVIELEVDSAAAWLSAWCQQAGVPVETPLIIRRQLEPGGRSRAFVNDTPVRLEQLRELGERLIHVHSQHHTLLLNDPRFQLGLVDQVAGHAKAVTAYRADHRAWRAVEEELARARAEEERSRAELDYLAFQLDELDQAQLKVDEQEALEAELDRAEHAGELLGALQHAERALSGEGGVVPALAALRQHLAKAARHDAGLATLVDRLHSVGIELDDIAGEAERMATAVVLDPAHATRLRERLDLLLRLQVKHRVKGTEELIAVREDLRDRHGRIGTLGERIAALERQAAAMRQHVRETAERLSAARRKAMPQLAVEVVAALKKLGMPHARFAFEHHLTDPGPDGMDAVHARFSANKDRAPEPLEKVASGGELGRVMLALLERSAEGLGLDCLVFDEIDTGVSGEVADRVGELMAAMARRRQVIAITHLPQIASKADVHLLVHKDHEAEAVTTHIRPVLADERVEVLARMLSGRKTTKAALENARELLKGR